MKPPFNMLRACFYLLAFIMILEVFTSILGGLVCVYTNFARAIGPEVGACKDAAAIIREIFSEVVTATLALLLAARDNK
jgi:hypothetical protein